MTNNITHTHLFHCWETLGQHTDLRQLRLHYKAVSRIGCLPTVYVIRKMTDNTYHDQLLLGGKRWIQPPEPLNYTSHVKHPLC